MRAESVNGDRALWLELSQTVKSVQQTLGELDAKCTHDISHQRDAIGALGARVNALAPHRSATGKNSTPEDYEAEQDEYSQFRTASLAQTLKQDLRHPTHASVLDPVVSMKLEGLVDEMLGRSVHTINDKLQTVEQAVATNESAWKGAEEKLTKVERSLRKAITQLDEATSDSIAHMITTITTEQARRLGDLETGISSKGLMNSSTRARAHALTYCC